MKNVMELLLEMDESKLDADTKNIEVKRLSKLAGEAVIFTCKGISVDKYAEAKENAIIGDELDEVEFKVFVVLEGVKSPDLKNTELCSKYKAVTPKELIKKLLKPGEINAIYEVVSELSGFGENVTEEIKN